MVRILSAADVVDLVDLPTAVSVLESVAREQADGGVVAWPPSLMKSGGAILVLRSGGLPGRGRMGVRVTTGPQNLSVAVIHETPGGRLIGLVGYPFSDIRLFASVALGTGLLARPDARRVAMIGTGRLALGSLEGVASVRKIESIQVYSPNPEHRGGFVQEAGERLGLSISATENARTAVEGADIVLVVTSSRTPAVRGEWLEPEAHVTEVGSRTEVDEEVFLRASLIVTTSKLQETNVHEPAEDWPLVKLTNEGRLTWDNIHELGEVVAGRVCRTSGITVFRDAQGGYGDIALAAWAFDRAVELGRGVDLDME